MDRLVGCLGEITQTQLSIRELANDLVQMTSGDSEAVNKLLAISKLASQCGYLTDLCCSEVGAEPFYEEFADWLLPPIFRSPLNN